MKILQVVYSGLGGVSSVAFSLVEGQNKNIKISNFFLFCGVEKLVSGYKKKCLILGIKYCYLKKKKFQINYKKILNILEKNSPDILIVHDYNLLPFFVYKIFNKKKLIYVHHTPDKTKNKLDWVIYFFNAILSDDVVLVSKRKKEDFMTKINNFFFQNKVNVIENGINTRKFKK